MRCQQPPRRDTVADGWAATAERLLESEPECPAHGLKAYGDAFVALWLLGDFAGAVEHAQRAVDIGTRQADSNVRMLGLSMKGLALVLQGHVA